MWDIVGFQLVKLKDFAEHIQYIFQWSTLFHTFNAATLRDFLSFFASMNKSNDEAMWSRMRSMLAQNLCVVAVEARSAPIHTDAREIAPPRNALKVTMRLEIYSYDFHDALSYFRGLENVRGHVSIQFTSFLRESHKPYPRFLRLSVSKNSKSLCHNSYAFLWKFTYINMQIPNIYEKLTISCKKC